MGTIPYSFWFQDYLPSRKTTRESMCIIITFVFSTFVLVIWPSIKKQITLGLARGQTTTVFDNLLDSSIIDTIHHNLKTNVFAQETLDHIVPSHICCSQSQHSYTDFTQFKWHDGLLFFKNLLYVPNGSYRLQVIQICHDTYTLGILVSIKSWIC